MDKLQLLYVHYSEKNIFNGISRTLRRQKDDLEPENKMKNLEAESQQAK